MFLIALIVNIQIDRGLLALEAVAQTMSVGSLWICSLRKDVWHNCLDQNGVSVSLVSFVPHSIASYVRVSFR